jgi:hypothetical protein
MDKKHEITKELKDIAPRLSELKKEKEGFQVPENYFGQMQREVFERINKDAELTVVTKNPRTIPLFRQPRFWLKVAGFALVLATATLLLLPDNNGHTDNYLAGFTPDEATEYINNNLDEFDLEDMLEVAQLDPVELFTPDNAAASDLPQEVLDEYIDEILDDFDLEELEEIL